MDHTSSSSYCIECRLANFCLPYGLEASEIGQLAAIIKNKRPLQVGEFLYLQGDQCLSLFAIKSGSFRSYVSNSEGMEQIIGFYLPGALMGLDSFQSGHFTCSTVALETSAVCVLPLNLLNELCAQIPRLQLQITRILGKEIAADHDKIILLAHRSAQEKIATFLLMLSLRYVALGFSDTQFNLSMRRQDIANFLGLTIETVSRQLTDLAKDGVVTIKQRDVQIKDLSLLKALVGHCLPSIL